jgi:hypothetical protein
VLFEVEEPNDSLRTICAEVFEGSTPLGGTCSRGLECAGDAYCALEDFQQCPGICTARKQAGEACMYDNDCALGGAQGVFCDLPEQGSQGEDQGVCVRATQVTHVAEGEACSVMAQGNEATLALCNEGLVCVGTREGENYRCQKPVAAGGVCTDNRECEAGSICLRDPDQEDAEEPVRHCQRFVRHGEGETCNAGPGGFNGADSIICWSLTVPLACDETGHCARAQLAQDGESCEERDCADGLQCWYRGFDQEALCKRPVGVGQSCAEAPCDYRAADCENDVCVAKCSY